MGRPKLNKTKSAANAHLEWRIAVYIRLAVLLGLVLLADLEETLILAFSTQFDPDAKSMFLMQDEEARMATYKQIQAYIKENFGYIPKTCWIAHMKEICGLNPQVVANRRSDAVRMYPCPPEKQDDLRQAFAHFNLI